MTHAIIILAHKNISQVARLAGYFERDCDVFIHIDKKQNNHLAVEFQEHIIGDLYLYLIREDINIPEGHMSGAYRTFNDENESLSSFFDLCVYQYQTVILSVWQNQVVGQYYPLFMLHNTTTTSYNTPFEPYEWKWHELFNILGINYSYIVSQ